MKATSSLIDFALSLDYAVKGVSEYKEYRDLLKVVDSRYLEHILHYQEFLQSKKDCTLNWVTDEYNVLHYILIDRKVSSYGDLVQRLQSLSRDEVFSLINAYALDSPSRQFHVRNLVNAHLSEVNRWRITELYYNFDNLKIALIENLTKLWEEYTRLISSLEHEFSRKIAQETQRIHDKSEDLFSTVFKDYISHDDFNSSTEQYLLLASIHRVIFIQNKEEKSIGTGIYTFDYSKLMHDVNSYGQEFREKILKALADPTRFDTLKLINEGIVSNKIIAQKFGISSAAVTYQLKYLLENRILIVESQSKKPMLNKKLLKAILTGVEKELFLDD
ncbi:hypothetical protein ACFQY8_01535 [Alloscardovia venturai]|uniref:HTH arsR-type domain-containing protein n=1 Tax=Alloscardovia venturai TaxID=1769421 RepID=A0ABW2Y788_9BIFI